MKALVSTLEPRQTGYRIAQVVADNETFPVASTLFWVACVNNVVTDQFWYDPVDQTIKPIPQPEPTEP